VILRLCDDVTNCDKPECDGQQHPAFVVVMRDVGKCWNAPIDPGFAPWLGGAFICSLLPTAEAANDTLQEIVIENLTTLINNTFNTTANASGITPLARGREIFEAILLALWKGLQYPVMLAVSLLVSLVQTLVLWVSDLDYSRPTTFAHLSTLAIMAYGASRLLLVLWRHVLKPSRPVCAVMVISTRAFAHCWSGCKALGRALTPTPRLPRPETPPTAGDTPELSMEEPATPVRAFPPLHEANEVPATPGVVVPPATRWAAVPRTQRARWDGGVRPTAPADAAEHEREQQAREKRLLAKYASKIDAKDYAAADTLESVAPSDRFMATDVNPILKALRVLDAMLLAVTSYADERPDITVGQMQYLLLHLLDRQVNGRWTRLREFVQHNESARWSDVVSEACRLLGVRTKADWEAVLRSFTRTAHKRPLTFLEYANRFITVARATRIAADSADLRNATLLHEYFVRGAQTPGFVHWAQERLMPASEPRREAYTDLTRSQQLALDWDALNERAKTASIQAEWRWGAEALKDAFTQLHAEARPTFADLWGGDMRERTLALFPEHEQAAIKKVLGGGHGGNFWVPPEGGEKKSGRRRGGGGENPPQPESQREPTPSLLPRENNQDQRGNELPATIVDGALESLKTRPPTTRELRQHRFCWKCGRKYPDCRNREGAAQGCTHADASRLRWNLFAYFPYPSIFYPELAGQRVSPMARLTEAEQGAVLERIAALGPAVQTAYPLQRIAPAPAAGGARPAATPALPNLLALHAKQDAATADTIAQVALAAMAPLVAPAALVRGIRGHESAWIADVRIGPKGTTTHALRQHDHCVPRASRRPARAHLHRAAAVVGRQHTCANPRGVRDERAPLQSSRPAPGARGRGGGRRSPTRRPAAPSWSHSVASAARSTGHGRRDDLLEERW
jgi:hypothetical protein